MNQRVSCPACLAQPRCQRMSPVVSLQCVRAVCSGLGLPCQTAAGAPAGPGARRAAGFRHVTAPGAGGFIGSGERTTAGVCGPTDTHRPDTTHPDTTRDPAGPTQEPPGRDGPVAARSGSVRFARRTEEATPWPLLAPPGGRQT